MSIFNPISMGNNGWNVVENRSASIDELAFDVLHEPTEWVVFCKVEISASSGRRVCYICKSSKETDYYQYTIRALGSTTWLQLANKASGVYTGGSFYITRNGTAFPSETYSGGVGDYVLVYI